ncbi:type IV secretion system protein [Brevundimonas sp. LF-1]|uniref:type IV secretion system protein n=1 Tax=Brevundimonas sp. LF-1 TaxID=3126100 RepID=UPI0030E0F183
MNARSLAALIGAVLLSSAPAVQAQHIVHDPTAYARLVEDARTALQQLRALQAQVEQGQALFDSLNAISDVNALASVLGLPEVRNPLPDLRALRAAADGDLTALGDLADRAAAIRRETRLYTPPSGDADTYYRDSLERSGLGRPGIWPSARPSARRPIRDSRAWKACAAPWTPPPTPAP